MSWEGSGLRLALAVDSHIFFANVRPDYHWGYFSKTLVYAHYKKDRSEFQVVFWNTANPEEKSVKNVRNVQAIRAADEYCLIVLKTEENQFALNLCNKIG
jgi:WD repeat-containing protein 35